MFADSAKIVLDIFLKPLKVSRQDCLKRGAFTGLFGSIGTGLSQEKEVKKDELTIKISKYTKKELKMTENCVYSRAYHSERRRSGRKELARKVGSEAVRKWLAEE